MIGLSCLSIVHGQALLGVVDSDTINALANITNITNVPNNVTLAAQASAMFASGASASSMPKNGMRAHHAPISHGLNPLRIKKAETLVPSEIAARMAGISFAFGKDSVIEIGWFRLNLESDGSPSSNDTVTALAALEAYQARESILLEQLEHKNEADIERAAFLDTLERKLKQDAADAEAKKQQDNDKLARDKKTLRDQRIAFSYKVMHALRNDPTGLTIYRGPAAPPAAHVTDLEYLNASQNASQHDSTSRHPDLLQYLDQRVIIAVVSLASKVMVILLTRAGRRARKTATCKKLAKQIERAMIFLGDPIVVYQEKIIERPVEIVKVVYVDRPVEATKEPAAEIVDKVAARVKEIAIRAVEAPEQVEEATQGDLSVVSSKQQVKVEVAAAPAPEALNNGALSNGILENNHATDRDLSVVLYKALPVVLYERKVKVEAAVAPAPAAFDNGVSGDNQATDEELPVVSEDNQATDEDLPVVPPKQEDKDEAAVAPAPGALNNGVSENHQAIDEDQSVVPSKQEDKDGAAVAPAPAAFDNGVSENNQATDEDQPVVPPKQEDKDEAAVALAPESLNSGRVESAISPALELSPAVSRRGITDCHHVSVEELPVVSSKQQDEDRAALAPTRAPTPAICIDGISEYNHATDRIAATAPKPDPLEVRRILLEKARRVHHRVLKGVWRILDDRMASDTAALKLSQRWAMQPAVYALPQVDWNQILKMAIGHPAVAPNREVIVSDFVRLVFGLDIAKAGPLLETLNRPQVHQELGYCPLLLHDARRRLSRRRPHRKGHGYNAARARLFQRFKNLTARRPSFGVMEAEQKCHKAWRALAIRLNGDLKKENDRVKALEINSQNWEVLALIDIPPEQPVRNENETAKQPEGPADERRKRMLEVKSAVIDGSAEKLVSTVNSSAKASAMSVQSRSSLSPPANPSGVSLNSSRHRPQTQMHSVDLAPTPTTAKVALRSACHIPVPNKDGNEPRLPNAVGDNQAPPSQKQPLDASAQLEPPSDQQEQQSSTEARLHIDQRLPEVDSSSGAKDSDVKELKKQADDSRKPMAEDKGTVTDEFAAKPVAIAQSSVKASAKLMESPCPPSLPTNALDTSLNSSRHRPQTRTQSTYLAPRPAVAKVGLSSSRHNPATQKDGNEQQLSNAVVAIKDFQAQNQPLDEPARVQSPSSVHSRNEKPFTEARSHIDQCLSERKREGEETRTFTDVSAETPVSSTKASAEPSAKLMESPSSLPLPANSSGTTLDSSRHRPQTQTKSSGLASRPIVAAKVALNSSRHNPATKTDGNEQQLSTAVGKSEASCAQKQPFDEPSQTMALPPEQEHGSSTEAPLHTGELECALPELESASESENEDDEQHKSSADGQPKRRPKGQGFAKKRAHLLAEITLALLDRPAKRQPSPVHAQWLALAESLNQRIKQENARISRLEKNPAGWEMLALIDVSKNVQYLHQAPLGMHRPPVTPLGMHRPSVMALGQLHAGPSPMSFAPRTPYPSPYRQQPGEAFPPLPTYGQLQAIQPRPMQPRAGVRGGPRPETAHQAVYGHQSKDGGKTGITRGMGIGSSVWSGRRRGGGRG
ncbi:hypothetical protein NliqN6_3444 [Naganishia liquefaciens]|uniref:Uncharacterized protein n=1 Tax=Naganishia liquefaciens TaxID=104408 RepID=A0A8H3YGA8_9TREE|nr:hypothetical protein NliqN6_3444 [Naganishia liquefaciens]